MMNPIQGVRMPTLRQIALCLLAAVLMMAVYGAGYLTPAECEECPDAEPEAPPEAEPEKAPEPAVETAPAD